MCDPYTSCAIHSCVLNYLVPLVFSSHSKQSRIATPADSDSDSESEEEQEDPEQDGEEKESQALPHSQPSVNPAEKDGAESLAFQDRTHFQLSLRVLGLMCDGQNRNLQVGIYSKVHGKSATCNTGTGAIQYRHTYEE